MNNMEKRPMKKQKRKVRKGFVVIVFLFLLALLAVLCLTVFFSVSNISVKNAQLTRYTKDQIIKASEIDVGENVITISSSEAEENIKKELPYIGEAEINKKLSGEIEIIVKATEEKYCIRSGDKYYLADKNFKILKEHKKAKESLINISGATLENKKIGEILSIKNAEKEETLEKILKKATDNGIKIDNINLKSLSSIKFQLNSKYEIDFGSVNAIDEKLDSLFKTIKEHIKIDSKTRGKFIISGEDWIFNPDN